MKLWLDDLRDPISHGHAGWEWVRTAEEAIEFLATGRVEEASLDHDLSGESTGYDVVCWLEAHPAYWPPQGVRVHSLNPVGRRRMQDVIDRHDGGF